LSSLQKSDILLSKYILLIISFYLIFGNFGRIGVSFNITEIIIFFIAPLFFLFKRIPIKTFFSALTLSTFLTISLIIGVFKSDIIIDYIQYNIRLMFQIITGFCFGISLWLYELKNNSFEKLITYYINIYITLCIVSLFILLIFPDSVVLWNLLLGIGYNLTSPDPHYMRVVSTYFDPNFFGNIVLLPFILSFVNIINNFSRNNLIKFGILFLSILLTFSRSTIAATLLCLLTMILLYLFISMKNRRIYKSTFIIFTVFICSTISILSSDFVINRLADRISSTSVSDGSTLARLESFSIGQELFLREPLLGYGYNFSIDLQKQLRGNIALDSSLQVILISFGLIGSMILFILFITYIINLIVKYKNAFQYEKLITFSFVLYLIISILFLSNFNQLIFYPFWIIPVIGVGTFLSIRHVNKK